MMTSLRLQLLFQSPLLLAPKEATKWAQIFPLFQTHTQAHTEQQCLSKPTCSQEGLCL